MTTSPENNYNRTLAASDNHQTLPDHQGRRNYHSEVQHLVIELQTKHYHQRQRISFDMTTSNGKNKIMYFKMYKIWNIKINLLCIGNILTKYGIYANSTFNKIYSTAFCCYYYYYYYCKIGNLQ